MVCSVSCNLNPAVLVYEMDAGSLAVNHRELGVFQLSRYHGLSGQTLATHRMAWAICAVAAWLALTGGFGLLLLLKYCFFWESFFDISVITADNYFHSFSSSIAKSVKFR